MDTKGGNLESVPYWAKADQCIHKINMHICIAIYCTSPCVIIAERYLAQYFPIQIPHTMVVILSNSIKHY